MKKYCIVVAFLLLAATGSSTHAQPVKNGTLPSPLPLFPPDNPWNVDISGAPPALNSAAFISFIGTTVGLHPDFGAEVNPEDLSNPEIYGIPFISVAGTQPLVPVTFVEFPSQSDSGFPGQPAGYPIPDEAKFQTRWYEGGQPGNVNPGGDRHMLIVDRDNHILYELYHTYWNAVQNRWEAGSGAVFSLDSNDRRPETWTSADASGMAILPGLIRYDEVFGPDPIRHAFRFTVRDTNGYVFPASHVAGSNASALPLGARLRLNPLKNISGYAPEIQKIFQAMKTYGLIVADNGSDMYIQGTYDSRWNNDVLNPAFSSLKASDFEVVQLGWQPAVTTSAGPLNYYTMPPCRIIDTRLPSGAPALAPTVSRVIRVAGTCGIPAGAKGIIGNLTAVSPVSGGYFAMYSGNSTTPLATAINFNAGKTRGNNVVVMLSSSGTGTVAIRPQSNGGNKVHMVLDVTGYLLPPPTFP